MEICSQKKITFSLTIRRIYGEINIVDGILVSSKREVVIWNMVMQEHLQIQISRT